MVPNREKWENPPTNISATVRFITRYMARVRRLRFFYMKKKWYKVHCYYSNRHGKEYSGPGDALVWYHGLLFFSLHTFNSLFPLLLVLPFRRTWKKFQLRKWTKKVDVSSAKLTNGDTLGRWSTVSVVGTNGLITFYSEYVSAETKEVEWCFPVL